MKLKLIRGLLHQIGLSKDALMSFGLRSLRSGAAGQALVNIMEGTEGVPEAHFYEALARALGHGDFTATTLTAYIGPLANLLYDNGAVCHGEEEGAVGGKPDHQARVARLAEYFPFTARGEVTDTDLAVRARNGAVCPPRLPPSLVEDVDPLVVAANCRKLAVEEELSRLSWRECILENAQKSGVVPPCLVVEGGKGKELTKRADAVEDERYDVRGIHTALRRKAIRHARSAQRGVIKREAQGEGDYLLLRFCPDLLIQAALIMKNYHLEKAANGMS